MITRVFWVFILTAGLTKAAAEAANRAPEVSIDWPRPGDFLSAGELIKIKAHANDLDGSIAQVQFFADTNLIAVVASPPFNVIWTVGVHISDLFPRWKLKAVAIDNAGAKTESVPVTVFYFTGRPPAPIVEMVSPPNGAFLAAPATFEFGAEILASAGEGTAKGGVEFFVGTNSVGLMDAAFSATATPSFVTVSNLPEGEHKLTVRSHIFNDIYCTCNLITNTIRVVKLGLQFPRVTPDGQFRFQVVTGFPNQDVVVQASTNLQDWSAIATNSPQANVFDFSVADPALLSWRFYRSVVTP